MKILKYKIPLEPAKDIDISQIECKKKLAGE